MMKNAKDRIILNKFNYFTITKPYIKSFEKRNKIKSVLYKVDEKIKLILYKVEKKINNSIFTCGKNGNIT